MIQKRPDLSVAHGALPGYSNVPGRIVASPVPVLIAGATGRVGETMIRLLEERHFPVAQLLPAATARSAGKTIVFRGEHVPIITLEQALHYTPGIALFAAGGAVSKVWAPLFVEKGWLVVDNSSYWRMTPDVPLIVPEINGHTLQPTDRLIANPNCSTIQMVMALAPLHKAYGLQRVVAATYQSVSGSGRKGEAQLERERTQALTHAAQPDANPVSPYPCPIDLNVIPQIGDFLEDGYSEEEHKMMNETKKIFNDPSIGVSATTVRVPVYGAHCVSVNVQLALPFTLEEVRRLLSSFPGLVLTDSPKGQVPFDAPESGPGLTSESRYGLAPGVQPALGYATPLTAKGSDAVYVSRVRRDTSIENGLELWTVADNIRKGAALNAVQIAEHLLMLRGSE